MKTKEKELYEIKKEKVHIETAKSDLKVLSAQVKKCEKVELKSPR